MSSLPPVRPGSKDGLIRFHGDKLGKIPDAEVAKLAGVSVRSVASYRARNKIPGYKGPRRKTPPASGPGGRRASRLENFMDILGKVPDRVVADKSGMSIGAVRNFRIKNGISASGPVGTTTEATVTGFRPTIVGGKTAAQAPAPKPMKTWKVVIIDSEDNQVDVRYTAATDLAEAAFKAKACETDELRVALVAIVGNFIV
jgi:hypothetical protein